MMKGYLSTSDIAKAVGVHANTVRLYEDWGFLPPIPRSPSGYRLFSQEHLDQMRVARKALHGQFDFTLPRPVNAQFLASVRHWRPFALGLGVLGVVMIQFGHALTQRAW